MSWSSRFPMAPKTYWWLRARYKDGSVSKPILIRVEDHDRYGIVYRTVGDADMWTPDEVEEDFRARDAMAEFAGPIALPEE